MTEIYTLTENPYVITTPTINDNIQNYYSSENITLNLTKI